MAGNMFSGFIQAGQNRSDAIGQGIEALAQGYQNKQTAEVNAQKQQQAMQLLDQASQLSDTNPQASQQAFMQAIQIAPEFVSQVTGAMKQRREAMAAGQSKPMTDYQRESIKLRSMEADLKREDNDLRRQKLMADIDAQKARVDQIEQKTDIEAQKAKVESDKLESSKSKSEELALEASRLAKEIANDDSFGAAVGTVSSMTPTFSGATQDLINKAMRLESLLTYENLDLMSGVLTDRDIAFLGRIGSGLNVTENGIKGSEAGVKERLNEIAQKIDQALSGSSDELSGTNGNAPKQALDYLRTNPSLIDQFEAKYGYRPEGF